MTKLDQLPEITDHVLSGLRADDSLKYKIYQKAAGGSLNEETKPSRRPLVALCAISAVMIAVFALVIPLTWQKSASFGQSDNTQNYDTMEISSIPAGTVLPDSPVSTTDENIFMPAEKQEADSEPDETDTETDPEKESEDFAEEANSSAP